MKVGKRFKTKNRNLKVGKEQTCNNYEKYVKITLIH